MKSSLNVPLLTDAALIWDNSYLNQDPELVALVVKSKQGRTLREKAA